MTAHCPVLAVDIGGTNTKVAVVSPSGETGPVEVFATASPDPGALVAKIQAAVPKQSFSAVAISIAGFLNDARDRLIYNPNLKWMVNHPIVDTFHRVFDLPVVIEVDSNAACLAEYVYGSGRGSRRFLCLTCGTGLGGGMTIDGELLRFNGACMGDVGHVIVDSFGLECCCGGHGCAEAFVSAGGIATRAGGPSLRDVLAGAANGDVEAASELASAGHALGIGIASLAHIFAPDRVAIAGGLSEAGDLVISAALDSFRHSAGTAYRGTQILKGDLGWKAPLIGAAAAAFREFSVRIP